tara:strand:- start:8160 stop:8459 length:300 start_codon:yes stop_codon:yes gene_type:complete
MIMILDFKKEPKFSDSVKKLLMFGILKVLKKKNMKIDIIDESAIVEKMKSKFIVASLPDIKRIIKKNNQNTIPPLDFMPLNKTNKLNFFKDLDISEIIL